MTDAMFKPGYEGERPSTVLTMPERQQFRQARADLIRRIHAAMLTLGALGGTMDLGIVTGGTPEHIVEFGDRVGEEQAQAPRTKFRPSASQVSDMDKALRLLEGLRPAYFKVVYFRALNEFGRENGEPGDWPWGKIGGYFGLSDRWAESAYDAAIVQAARRSGVLPMVTRDFAVVVAAAWVDRAWLTNVGTAADPRQAVSNLRSKSPVKIEQAFAIWTDGQPVAKRLVTDVRAGMRNLLSHGAWYKVHPDTVNERLVTRAREINAGWMIDDIPLSGLIAA